MTNLAHDKTTDTATGRFEWERLVRRIKMPWRVKSFAFVLSTWADPDGSQVRPGIDVLAAVTGLGEKTVRNLMKELRDEYGLIEMVARGGGRAGKGKVNRYQLSIPTDLLDRFEMLPPDCQKPRLTGHLVTVHSAESPVPQTTGQSDDPPVDNSEMTGSHNDRSIPDENDFHRYLGDQNDGMTGKSERMTGNSADRLPPTRPTTTDHPTTPDPAQPPTAREDQPGLDIDHGESEVTPLAEPARCEHNLTRRRRPDGKPTCALCRRAEATT